ncbi:hypothetical protein AVEN_247315-1 [Araneus ventricosus]|uniref:Uncharacterized protein n=1 Tax=Araneus ventricosus TaxID=182803 RepID=A0A4Y2Q1H1_ARAVE|nr:hypothetical protein AVEN_247315-1 [Araneus ventricosus]
MFDSKNTDISLYLTLFVTQARAASIEEEEWMSQLISLLPLELAQIIIKEPEEQMREYANVKKILLDRFKMNPETFRVKYTQHQKRPCALWKELVFNPLAATTALPARHANCQTHGRAAEMSHACFLLLFKRVGIRCGAILSC